MQLRERERAGYVLKVGESADNETRESAVRDETADSEAPPTTVGAGQSETVHIADDGQDFKSIV